MSVPFAITPFSRWTLVARAPRGTSRRVSISFSFPITTSPFVNSEGLGWALSGFPESLPERPLGRAAGAAWPAPSLQWSQLFLACFGEFSLFCSLLLPGSFPLLLGTRETESYGLIPGLKGLHPLPPQLLRRLQEMQPRGVLRKLVLQQGILNAN